MNTIDTLSQKTLAIMKRFQKPDSDEQRGFDKIHCLDNKLIVSDTARACVVLPENINEFDFDNVVILGENIKRTKTIVKVETGEFYTRGKNKGQPKTINTEEVVETTSEAKLNLERVLKEATFDAPKELSRKQVNALIVACKEKVKEHKEWLREMESAGNYVSLEMLNPRIFIDTENGFELTDEPDRMVFTLICFNAQFLKDSLEFMLSVDKDKVFYVYHGNSVKPVVFKSGHNYSLLMPTRRSV
jgi:hypothetical protein